MMKIKEYKMMALGLFSVLLLGMPLSAMAAETFIEWSSSESGAGGGITATVYSKIIKGELGFTTITADNFDFTSEFDSTFSNLHYRNPDPNNSADIFSVITFSSPLPDGSKIIAIDVDYYEETVSLTNGSAPLNLLSQIETTAGAESVFPTYNSLTGQLQATTDVENDNQKEASVFDASGLSSIQITFEKGKGSGILIAIFVGSNTIQQTFTQADMDTAIEEALLNGFEEGFQAGTDACDNSSLELDSDMDSDEISVTEFEIKAFNVHTATGKFNLNCDLTYDNSDKNKNVDVELTLNGEIVFTSNCKLKSAETIIGYFSSTPTEGLIEYYLDGEPLGSFYIQYKNGNSTNELHLVK